MPRPPLTTAALFAALEAAHGNVAAAARALHVPPATLHARLCTIPDVEIPDVVLWHRLRRRPRCTNIRDTLIARYVPHVRAVARKLKSRVPRHVDLDTLVSAGQLGLLEAVDRYDHTCGTAFAAYAMPRIRGAIFDELRRLDPASRHTRKWQAQREAAEADLAHHNGHAPTPDQVAATLDWTPSQFAASQPPHIEDLHWSHADSTVDDSPNRDLPDPQPDADPASMACRASRTARAAALARATRCLPFEYRVVLYLHYTRGRPLCAIAEAMDLSAARICQMHSRAVVYLREHKTKEELIEVLM